MDIVVVTARPLFSKKIEIDQTGPNVQFSLLVVLITYLTLPYL